MGADSINQDPNGILEDFRLDFRECWSRFPNKGFFAGLAAAWLGLFLLVGNSTLGYVHSPSLFSWVLDAYHPAGDYLASDDGHGILVPFIVLAILWWKRKDFLELPLRIWSPGLVIVVLSLALHLLGYMIQQPRLSLVAFFSGVYGLMGLAWGPEMLRRAFFPFFLLGFCIPVSTQLQPVTFYLRLWVCQIVEFISHNFLAIDVIRIGTALRDPTGQYQYEVAAACSGLRSQVATLGLAFCFAFLSLTTWWKRDVLILSAFPLAVLGNTLRMLMIIIAADFGGQEWGNYVHDGGPFGIVSLMPYIPAFFGLMYLEQWLRKSPSGQPPFRTPNGALWSGQVEKTESAPASKEER